MFPAELSAALDITSPRIPSLQNCKLGLNLFVQINNAKLSSLSSTLMQCLCLCFSHDAEKLERQKFMEQEP